MEAQFSQDKLHSAPLRITYLHSCNIIFAYVIITNKVLDIQKGVMLDKDSLFCWKFNANTAFPSYKCIYSELKMMTHIFLYMSIELKTPKEYFE